MKLKLPFLNLEITMTRSMLRLPTRILIPVWCVLTVIFTAFYMWSIPDLKPYNESSRTLNAEDGSLLAATRSSDDRIRLKTSAADVDPLYLKMLLASEDRRFYEHLGVDPIAVGRAMVSNFKADAIVSGASTIAMQTARALGHHPRTLLYKLKEACAATYMTLSLGRDKVLDLYLTLAPFGGDVEGVRAASLKWFGHEPNHLTPEEAALLVALPRAPERIRPDRHPEIASRYVADVLRLAVEQGVIGADTAKATSEMSLPSSMKALPGSQRALASLLFERNPGSDLKTTLSPAVQLTLENAGRGFRQEHAAPLEMAAVVIDTDANEVKGYLASADGSSFIPLPHAIRSPGSTLKSFAYALSFEQGLLHPKSLIADEQEIFGSWAPRNYSGRFKGTVTAEDALIYSLNVPALKVMDSLSPELFMERLNAAGPAIVLPRGAAPSLSVILGGCGVSLEKLTALYAMLENDGIYREPEILQDENTSSEEHRVLMSGAARAVSEILKKVPAPRGFAANGKISYKTGTSWGSRDAWAVGSSGQYTVGIWVGRPDGASIPAITGYGTAAPLLFGIFEGLELREKSNPALSESERLSPEAPEILRDLRVSKENLDEKSLSIEYPQDGSKIAPGVTGRIYLMTKGGVPPFYLNVNGHGEEDPGSFAPAASGSYRATVLDSAGHAATSTVEVTLK